jgi:hypothetical protein
MSLYNKATKIKDSIEAGKEDLWLSKIQKAKKGRALTIWALPTKPAFLYETLKISCNV